MQPLSTGVGTDFKVGDIIHTGDQQVLGGTEEPVMFIPFHVMKVNVKKRGDVSPKEYICTEPYDENRPWEEDGYVWEQRDGNKITCKANNYRTYIVHGVVPGGDDFTLPVSVSFQSSAGKGSRPIISHFATVGERNRVLSANHKPYTFVWALTSEHVKEKGQSYMKWVCKKERKASEEEIGECDQWALALSRNAQAYADHSAKQDPDLTQNVENSAEPVTSQANLDDVPF